MLFSYKYVPHQMDKMQSFIDYIFFDVWCKAPKGQPFSLELFEANTELWEVMKDFCFKHDIYFNEPRTKGSQSGGKPRAVIFYEHVTAIYQSFSKLTQQQIDQFGQWYKANNEIEKVCSNDPTIKIARYADIKADYPELSKQLASFFITLYSQDLLKLVALGEKIGKINQHYSDFIKINNVGKCPFCGIEKIKGQYHSKREPYDHYLPKSIYPFNSINFRNLAPACHDCNSAYKLSRDPAYSAGIRRKFFYPYSTTSTPIEIYIELNTSNVIDLSPDNIQLIFGPSAIGEEIETWKDVYGIEERYTAMFCEGGDAEFWLEQARISYHDKGKDIDDTLMVYRKISIRDKNFLKVPFLEACYRIGLFE